MPFHDEAIITVRSGNGGHGCVSFRREKFIPKGGPDGGDGGSGGDIVVVADPKLHTLTDYRARPFMKAGNGSPGKGKNQSGRNGEDLLLKIPLGTVVQDAVDGEILADVVRDTNRAVLLRGGQGGKGNSRFATSTNRAPSTAQPGQPGQERRLKLTLKFIADVGLVGLPNAGKSTLLSRLSMARPRVDAYPFTTLIPNLGVMTTADSATVVIADVPGLIEGASRGRGLGHRFLRHIERTKLLVHLLDITYPPADDDILEDFHTVVNEMKAYDPALIEKPCMVLITKMDLAGPGHRDVRQLQDALGAEGVESLPVSAVTGEGLEEAATRITTLWISHITREDRPDEAEPGGDTS